MIEMRTFDEIRRQAHSLGLYCARCERWDEADLEGLAEAGFGGRRVTDARFRCRDCGEPAEKQLRPPVPAGNAANAYIDGMFAGQGL